MADATKIPELTQSGGFLHPERIVGSFGLRPGMIVADFGAGSGYFAIPAARIVGQNGKVYALDIQKSALGLLKSRADLEHLLHVETIWADLEMTKGSRLADDAVDFVILSNILFQSEKKRNVIAEALRVVRTGGSVAILDWDDTPFPAGPPMLLRITKQATLRLAEEVGLHFIKQLPAGDHHYGLLFKKES